MRKNLFKIILVLIFINMFGFTLAADNNFVISDKNGNIISDEVFSSNTSFLPAYNPKNLIIKKYVNKKEQSKVINSSGKYLFNDAYEHVIPLTSKIYLVEKNKKKYILNENGTRLLTPNDSAIAESINENSFAVKEFNTKSSGSGSIKDNFMAKHQSVIYNNDMKKIYDGDMTYTKNIVPENIFVKIDDSNGKIIDSNGNIILNGVKYCENYKPGIIYVKTDLKEGIYDIKQHSWVYDKTIRGIPEIGSDYAIIPVVKNGETFAILADKNLKPHKSQEYYYYILPDNNVFLASTNGIAANKVLNAKSKVIYTAKNGENIENATLKNAVISKNGKFSLKTIKGKVILAEKYDNITINPDVILTQNGNNFEILNGKYKTVSKFSANSAKLRNNIIFVQGNEDFKLIDAITGKILLSSDNIQEYSMENNFGNIECLYIVSKNGKKGIINSKNSVIIPFEYDDITSMKYSNTDKDELTFALKQGNKYAISNIKTKSHGNFVYSLQPVQTFDNFTILKK